LVVLFFLLYICRHNFKTIEMKAKDLAAILLQHPERDVIFWNGTDNVDIDSATPDECNDVEVVLCNVHQTNNPEPDVTIATLMANSILENEDYRQVELEPQEAKDLLYLCNMWEDRDSIEIEINQFLNRNGYCFDDEECSWYNPLKQ